ncbi:MULTISPECIES: ATP-binding protein [Arthrobacter]|uniref:ATP-binding protein n=2 Tax=Arthrobacter TaxID=1663 RepID=A0ABU9KM49_9MICC|nr:ATP-binding protein [Arthrobacter sp. YJM1]MDP5226782.1 ATP-binding protein [Arthrobacter sp. YJM1]
MSIPVLLPIGDEVNPGQMRLARVHLVNWGTFHGAHVMHVDRRGTLLTGNSGVGKSTLFDAMLRVFDARPRSNEAAAARMGGSVDDRRTTYTYMRGKVGDRATSDGATSAFQRPGATWSAVALTFDNAAGTAVTLSALFDLPKNGTEGNVGRHYMIDARPLDLDVLESLAHKRFTRAALEDAFPGSQVFDVHRNFAERFRRILGIGSDQALPLLRVIQAGKGLGGSVNTFFRDQVLDPPATLDAADAVVEEFSNLISIRQRLEDVRKQRDALAPVPQLNKDYAQHLLEANRLRTLAGTEFDAQRQALAVVVHEGTVARLKALAVDKAQALKAERMSRDALAAQLRELELDYNNQGGNAIASIEAGLENARLAQRLRRDLEAGVQKQLRDAGLDLEWSAAGWAQAHQQAEQRAAELTGDAESLKALRFEAFDAHAAAKRELEEASRELTSLQSGTSLMPQAALENRAAIAAALDVEASELPFAGELMDLLPAEDAWRPAAERALRNLATTLLVPGSLFGAVTEFLDGTTVRGAIRAVDVSRVLPGASGALASVEDGDLLTKLQFLSGSLTPARESAVEWLRSRIALDYAYPCVEDPARLAGLERGLSLGGVVKRNSHTVEKDDRFAARRDFVLGFDNASKVLMVQERITELKASLKAAETEAQDREDSHQGVARQLEALRRVASDHREWTEVSAQVAAEEVARLERRLADALAAQADLEPLRARLEQTRGQHQASTEAAAVLQNEYKALDVQLVAADKALGAALKRVEENPPAPSTVEALAPRFEAMGEFLDMSGLDLAAVQVRAQLQDELHRAESLAQSTAETLTRIFDVFSRAWGGTVSVDHGTGIGAAPEYEQRYHAIVRDGLPAQEEEFRAFFNQRTHESFSTLLHLLDEERRAITSRILPLNGILSGVEFHEGSHLELDIKQTVPASAKAFKDAISRALRVRAGRAAVSSEAHDGAAAGGEDELTIRYKTLENLVTRLSSQAPEDRRWRAEVLDVRGHLFIACKEHRTVRVDGGAPRAEVFMHSDTGSMSGGERQRFTAFIMAAALSYQLGIAEQGFTSYGTVMMDEAFVLASEEFAGQGIAALHEFGFQLLLAAPENVIDLSRHLGSVTEILRDRRTNRSGVLPLGGKAAPGEPRSEANPVDIRLG